MSPKYISGSIQRVTSLTRYLGGQMITLNGANVGCSVPSDTHLIIIRARGGDVYYAVNGAAGAGSPGYVPDGSIELVGFGSISNLSMLSVYGAAGAFAHIQYYDEA